MRRTPSDAGVLWSTTSPEQFRLAQCVPCDRHMQNPVGTITGETWILRQWLGRASGGCWANRLHLVKVRDRIKPAWLLRVQKARLQHGRLECWGSIKDVLYVAAGVFNKIMWDQPSVRSCGLPAFKCRFYISTLWCPNGNVGGMEPDKLSESLQGAGKGPTRWYRI